MARREPPYSALRRGETGYELSSSFAPGQKTSRLDLSSRWTTEPATLSLCPSGERQGQLFTDLLDGRVRVPDPTLRAQGVGLCRSLGEFAQGLLPICEATPLEACRLLARPRVSNWTSVSFDTEAEATHARPGRAPLGSLNAVLYSDRLDLQGSDALRFSAARTKSWGRGPSRRGASAATRGADCLAHDFGSTIGSGPSTFGRAIALAVACAIGGVPRRSLRCRFQ